MSHRIHRTEEDKKTDVVVPKLLTCARCGGSHRNLTFMKLSRPMEDLTHWTPCPSNGQPITMKITQ